MPKVTKIEQQKKRIGRYSVYIDAEYSFSLSEADLVATGVYSGQEVAESKLVMLRAMSEESKLVDRVYGYLGYRQRTESEVRDYLKRHDCSQDQVDDIIRRLKAQSMISDDKFVSSWINSRQSLRPRSRRKLEQELRQKGVEPELIAEALSNVSDDDQIEAIQSLAKKKLIQIKYLDQTKLVSYLLAQGFDYALVKRALEDLGAASGE